MAPAGKNLCAVLIAVLVLVAIATGESASIGDYDCNNNRHLSGNYKGVCFGVFSDADCQHVCLDESSDNYDGICNFYLQCECWAYCTPSETVATATSAPIPA